MVASLTIFVLYFFGVVLIAYFFWWWLGDQFWRRYYCCWCWKRRGPSRRDREAIASIQREILRVQLQQDVQVHLRILQAAQQRAGQGNNNNPEAVEELANFNLKRRKQIRFHLQCREYDDTVATNRTTTIADEEQASQPSSSSQHCQRYAICNICLSEYQNGEEVSDGPVCHHVFHTECIIDWLLCNDHCPMCRQVFLPPLAVVGEEQATEEVRRRNQDVADDDEEANGGGGEVPQQEEQQQQQQSPPTTITITTETTRVD